MNKKKDSETVLVQGGTTMDIKDFGVTRLISHIRSGYRLRQYTNSHGMGWLKDRTILDLSEDIKIWAARMGLPVPEEEARTDMARDFIEWVMDNPKEVEVWLAKKSPSNACKLAISYRTRLQPEAEKIIMEKAKDKSNLLEYCSFFSVVLTDLTNVTLKAAFAEGEQEKKYIKKLAETKKNLKMFLVQLLNADQIKSGQTVLELLETLD